MSDEGFTQLFDQIHVKHANDPINDSFPNKLCLVTATEPHFFPAELGLLRLLGRRGRRRRGGGPRRGRLRLGLLGDAVQREAPLLELDHGAAVVLHLQRPRPHRVLVPVDDLE